MKLPAVKPKTSPKEKEREALVKLRRVVEEFLDLDEMIRGHL